MKKCSTISTDFYTGLPLFLKIFLGYLGDFRSLFDKNLGDFIS